jgi:sugar phosphate isomerase/epimerase
MDATRRGFLATGALAASLPFFGTVRAAAKENVKRWRSAVGLNGFMSSAQTFEKTYPIWEILDYASNVGFEGIELVEGWPMGGYPSPDDAKRVAALKRMYDAYGLKIHTIQTFGSGSYSADPNARRDWLNGFRNQVRLAKKLGCDFLGNWPGGGMEGNADINAAISSLASSYREAAKMCADEGMHLSFEIEPPFIFNTLDHLKRILAEVDHPACRTNFDPSHFDIMSGGKGKPSGILKELGVKHIGHVHLTDSDGAIYKGTSRHLACGEGHCDIEASLDILWNDGYEGWLMIDAWMIEDVYNAATKGKQAIDAAIERNSKRG